MSPTHLFLPTSPLSNTPPLAPLANLPSPRRSSTFLLRSVSPNGAPLSALPRPLRWLERRAGSRAAREDLEEGEGEGVYGMDIRLGMRRGVSGETWRRGGGGGQAIIRVAFLLAAVDGGDGAVEG